MKVKAVLVLDSKKSDIEIDIKSIAFDFEWYGVGCTTGTHYLQYEGTRYSIGHDGCDNILIEYAHAVAREYVRSFDDRPMWKSRQVFKNKNCLACHEFSVKVTDKYTHFYLIKNGKVVAIWNTPDVFFQMEEDEIWEEIKDMM